MKRDIIIIEDKAVSVTGNDVWMTAGEIAGLFHTGVPAVNAAIKAILKAGRVRVTTRYAATFNLKTVCMRMFTRLRSSSPSLSD